MRTSLPTIIATTWIVASGALVARADLTPLEIAEARCNSGRYKANAAYAACQNKLLAKIFAVNPGGNPDAGFSKCRIKYGAAWNKLQAEASGTGSACDGPRYRDNGDGTVTDVLTNLQWEQKTDDGSAHDKDNEYTWTDPGNGNDADADGTVYTTFLETLNNGPCLGGHCDWRLPTVSELQSILLLEPYPCINSPCVDQIAFGPSAAVYWSSTTSFDWPAADGVWWVFFVDGLTTTGISKDSLVWARAVRGTL